MLSVKFKLVNGVSNRAVRESERSIKVQIEWFAKVDGESFYPVKGVPVI